MKVYSPNKGYTGISASVSFCNGVGETDNPHLLEWFRAHGYIMAEEKAPKDSEEAAGNPGINTKKQSVKGTGG